MGLLYRLGAMRSAANTLPIVIMAREDGLRLVRELEAGAELQLTTRIDVEDGPAFESRNVIAEIPGTDLAEEIVLFGAHLDSYGLGTGANDNGCNVAMLIDIARQMTRLGIRPRRTVRLALWNGEEQGFNGSWRYTETHHDEMDRHVVAASIDIGSGRITGFWTNGRGEELTPVLERALGPVAELGPFAHSDDAIFGTDNFDFMINGVANLVAIHDTANYGPNYHAESDTFDKVDQTQLRLNAAIVAAAILGFANDEAVALPRHSRAQVEELVSTTPLGAEMRAWHVYDAWASGERGRR
jgi:Zn-dependent M28 family amino/carboxypeptidase